jgi:hypothetical protein
LKNVLQNIALFLILNLLLLLFILWLGNKRLERFEFNYGNTESNVLFIPEKTEHDVLILGSSHARSFARTGNHQRMENILDKKVANLSKGHGAGGIKNQLIYFDYFLGQGNTAGTLLYFVDPFVFYNDKMDNHNFIFNNEPFRFNFTKILLKHGTRAETFVNYLKFKMKPYDYWWNYKPDTIMQEIRFLTAIDSNNFEKRIAVMYANGMKQEIKKEKTEYLMKLIDLAEANKMKIIFVVPPTLLGKLPDHENMLQTLREIAKDIPVYDYSTSVTQPEYYYDLDHLNTTGCNYFTENYLKKILSN